MLELLQSLSQRLINEKNRPFKRYFIKTQGFKHRLCILKGPRGAGKTTMLVQHLLACAGGNAQSNDILYLPADHFQLQSATLYEIAEAFVMEGGKWLAIDEIHRYDNWSKEIKSIYDTFSKLHIVCSGSSALHLNKGGHELSRRALIYSLLPMSFREYLSLNHQIDFKSFNLKTLLENYKELAADIIHTLEKSNHKIMPFFHHYLKYGYYPYSREFKNETQYQLTLAQNIDATIHADLSAVYPEMTGALLKKLTKLLKFISTQVPFTPNWLNIKKAIDVADNRTVKNYCHYLESAKLIQVLEKESNKFTNLEQYGKIYLNDPNQMYALGGDNQNKGTVRETFFLSAIKYNHTATQPPSGDFLIDKQYLFEVGGKSKDFHQIKGKKNAWLACDQIEYASTSRIPLWLFGFLY